MGPVRRAGPIGALRTRHFLCHANATRLRYLRLSSGSSSGAWGKLMIVKTWARSDGLPFAGGLIVLLAAAALPSDALAQAPPSRLQGPPASPLPPAAAPPALAQPAPATADLLERERFRRRAAEIAQKQLEVLAEQLREQLSFEIAQRKAAEAELSQAATRIKLTDQIDEERQRLLDDAMRKIKQQRDVLERQNLTLTQQLSAEASRRRALEVRLREAEALVQQTEPDAQGGAGGKLASRVEELERALNAAQWARKLAEAQLKLATERQNRNNSR